MEDPQGRRVCDNYAVTISGGKNSELIQFQVSRRLAHGLIVGVALLGLLGLAGLFLLGGLIHRAQEANRIKSDNLLLSRQLTRMSELEARVIQLDHTRIELLQLMGIDTPDTDPTLVRPGADLRSTQSSVYLPAEPGGEVTAEELENLKRLISQLPLDGPVTRFFGPLDDRGVFHAGIDVAGKEGADIVSAGSGIVIQIAEDEVFGKVIVVAHDPGIETVYGHNSRILCKIGDFVSAGQKIAEVGSTGQSSAPHLHFEIRWQHQAIDPSLFFSPWQVLEEAQQ